MTLMEIKFGLQGKTLPADHGYALYSAIKNNLQILEHPLKNKILQNSEKSEEKSLPLEVLISGISGNPNGNKVINLN
ncbi:MAG: type I-MYXAN CRISPR-associated protein Cas6/Cmx6, partial [Pseudanabaena sp.]